MKKLIGFLLALFISYSLSGQKFVIPEVDNNSYEGKAMFGYQGWYGHPDDGTSLHDFFHWGNMEIISMETLDVEMYPDLREYCSNERYPTAYTLPDGKVADVFSAGNKQTVIRHMKWIRDYNTDGVWVQRFISECVDPNSRSFRDSTTTFVKEGCQIYGRIFAIMYDGLAGMADEIKTDWKHLVDDLKITESDRYLNHNELPIVALWGYTVVEEAKVEELEELIEFFHNNPESKYRAAIKLGVNDNWFLKDQRWLGAFSQVEVISPWSVGRYKYPIEYENYITNQLQPGMNWCAEHDILFVPVLFPGFSWHNLKNGEPKNHYPRNGGDFFWMQVHGALSNNAKTFYFAMFDEMDEATAFFKTAENSSMAPVQEYWLNLDADGYNLPSDWYLRCAGKAAETLRGNITNSSSLGLPDEGIMTIYPGIDSCNITFTFPDFDDVAAIEISLDGGNTFPYLVSDDVGTYEIKNLYISTYDVLVRDADSIQKIVPMGKVCVESDCIGTSSKFLPIKSNIKGVKIYPNPFKSRINFEGLNEGTRIQIIDLRGTLHKTFYPDERNYVLDVSYLTNAIYLLSIIDNRHQQFIKVIKSD